MARQTTESSFDELTRGLASGSISRGRALRLMGAALVGGTLGSLGISEVAAAPRGCKRDGKKCKKDKQCCGGNCVNGTCAACPAGRVLLSNGTCALPCGRPGDPLCPACVEHHCEPDPGSEAFCVGARVGPCPPSDCPTGLCPPGGGCSTGQICRDGVCFVAC
jgi:hypothetical protein